PSSVIMAVSPIIIPICARGAGGGAGGGATATLVSTALLDPFEHPASAQAASEIVSNGKRRVRGATIGVPEKGSDAGKVRDGVVKGPAGAVGVGEVGTRKSLWVGGAQSFLHSGPRPLGCCPRGRWRSHPLCEDSNVPARFVVFRAHGRIAARVLRERNRAAHDRHVQPAEDEDGEVALDYGASGYDADASAGVRRARKWRRFEPALRRCAVLLER